MATAIHARFLKAPGILFLGLVFFLSGPVVGAHGDNGSGQVRLIITLETDKLTLGTDKETGVQVTLTGLEGLADSEYDLNFEVSTGKIADVKKGKNGITTLRYLAPDTFYPQCAIIVAVARGAFGVATGHVILPLWGVGEALVKTRAGGSVTLTIADTSFGPIRADNRGRARVPFVAPPGEGFGTFGKKKVDLQLPETQRLVAVAGSDRVTAGSAEATFVWVYTISEDGAPLEKGEIQYRASSGRLVDMGGAQPGVRHFAYHPPELVEEGEATLVFSLAGHSASTNEITATLVPGPPERMVATAKTSGYSAGQNEPVRITVDVFDKYGNRTGADLQAGTSLGQLGEIQEIAVGKYEVPLTLPSFFEGADSVRVLFTTSVGSKPLRAEVAFPVMGGVPALVELEPQSDIVYLGWENEVKIRANIRDRFGNRIPGPQLSAVASEGEVRSTARSSTGEWTLSYAPPAKPQTREVILRVSGGNTSSNVQLELVPQKWLFVTPYVGFVTNFSELNSPYAVAKVDFGLDVLLRGSVVSVAAGYYFNREESGEFDLSSTLHIIPLYGSLGYKVQAARRLWFQFSVGAGVHFTVADTTLPSGEQVSNRDATWGIRGGLETLIHAGSGDIAIDLSYTHADVSRVERVEGRLGGLSLLVGYRFGVI
ncbi:MAG: outer membrane beta-barrel protein [Proteobacteria bacterium]|nr:outer membrane beta-barrel protein [Pseudomonadota bacterium]